LPKHKKIVTQRRHRHPPAVSLSRKGPEAFPWDAASAQPAAVITTRRMVGTSAPGSKRWGVTQVVTAESSLWENA
jgi:hypothetical protein